ncbi:hypothetical protein ABEB36_001611 [Hypothenemus hampei]|uniref:Uncharacterized protein n=1 Tax=Hypothenemus hampei TaxID=57062 RepID=A0ABD1FF47_HYPHA
MHFGPTTKITIGWIVCVTGGLGLFYLAKRNIDKQRYENMKSRQRMRAANEGNYEQSYRNFPVSR